MYYTTLAVKKFSLAKRKANHGANEGLSGTVFICLTPKVYHGSTKFSTEIQKFVMKFVERRDLMLESWIGEVVGRMRVAGITNARLAAECEYTEAYLSAVLHGKKGVDNTRTRIFNALAKLEREQMEAENAEN